jgi:hypothetical protein
MYAEVSWYSKNRNQAVAVAINGGGVSYDRLGLGFKPVPENKRLKVLKALWDFQDELEEIFLGDGNIQERRWNPMARIGNEATLILKLAKEKMRGSLDASLVEVKRWHKDKAADFFDGYGVGYRAALGGYQDTLDNIVTEIEGRWAMALTKQEGIELLEKSKVMMAEAKTKDEAIAVLQSAGSAVGYKPAMRVLVYGTEPDKAIKWG